MAYACAACHSENVRRKQTLTDEQGVRTDTIECQNCGFVSEQGAMTESDYGIDRGCDE